MSPTSTPEPEETSSPAPIRVGDYEVVRPLGRGGMAEVFLAQRRGADAFVREVVIKRILPELAGQREFVDLFRDEARITASLRHGNIVQVLEFIQHDGQYALVLEYVDGQSLAAILAHLKREGRKLPAPVVAYVLSEVARALDYAHRKAAPDGTPLKVIHRDVSPANILVSFDGEVKLADFGIARAASRITATSGSIRGKLDYLSPETLEGAPAQASDLYSLGMMGWEMCSGQPAFPAETIEARMRRILTEDVPLLTDVPPALADAIARLTRRNATERPLRAIEIAHQLAPLFSGAAVAEVLGARVRDASSASHAAPTPRRSLAGATRSNATRSNATRSNATRSNAATALMPSPARPESMRVPRRAQPEPERWRPEPEEGTPLPGSLPEGDVGLTNRAARGAENLVRRCLEVLHTERVCLFTHHADAVGRLFERALESAGAEIRVVDLALVAPASFGVDAAVLALGRATASVAIGNDVPREMAAAIRRAASIAGSRHLNVSGVDLRVMASSARADPAQLEKLNDAVVGRLEAARTLELETTNGTALSVRLQAHFPLASDACRPTAFEQATVPGGQVFFHPASVSGMLVVDRLAVFTDASSLDARALRRTPITFAFRRGAVESVACSDDGLREQVERYLAHHPDAGRVGLVAIPTNYLAFAELGLPAHDAYLPGARILLGGPTDPRRSNAPFDLDRGLTLAGRRTTVTCGGETLVAQGRLAGPLAP